MFSQYRESRENKIQVTQRFVISKETYKKKIQMVRKILNNSLEYLLSFSKLLPDDCVLSQIHYVLECRKV